VVFIQGTRFTRGGGTNRKGAAGTCCPLPIGPIHIEDGTVRVFRNVGIRQSDAGELPKRIHTRFKTRRKFEIKNMERTLCSVYS
jgi:hypothetical protein